MRVAYYALHYGKEYLAWSIRSIQDAVDAIHIFYTDKPSYGHRSTLRCPDSEEELRAEAYRFAQKPIHWHRGHWGSEASHRSAIYDHTQAEQALVVDADEVWLPGMAELALEFGRETRAGCVGVPFVHYWRSFGWVCHDHWQPIRVLNLASPRSSTAFIDLPEPVQHFGYAQSVELLRYKWSCHGHKDELRPGWLDRFEAWRPGEPYADAHPTTHHIWTPIEADPQKLDVVLADHPYRHLSVIP